MCLSKGARGIDAALGVGPHRVSQNTHTPAEETFRAALAHVNHTTLVHGLATFNYQFLFIITHHTMLLPVENPLPGGQEIPHDCARDVSAAYHVA
jgi:hypothetical protein